MKIKNFFWASLLCAGSVLAQNPMLLYSTNGLQVLPTGQHSGKVYVGIDTNSTFWSNTLSSASVTYATTAGVANTALAGPFVAINNGTATNLSVVGSTLTITNGGGKSVFGPSIGGGGECLWVNPIGARTDGNFFYCVDATGRAYLNSQNGFNFRNGNSDNFTMVGGLFSISITFQCTQPATFTSTTTFSAGGSSVSNINTAVGTAVAWPALTNIGQTDTNTLALTGASPTASHIPPPTISPADLGATYAVECVSNNVVSVYRTALISVGAVTNRVRVITTGF